MKRKPYPLVMALAALLLVTACKKNNTEKPFIEDKNLTSCPIGGNCQYLFTEHADLGAQTNFIPGDYRLFWYHRATAGVTTRAYLKTPMQGDKFELNKTDLLNGKVAIESGCPTCFSIPMVITDGYVKGINTTPKARADQAVWLIEAKIIRTPVDNPGAVSDTLSFKQKFTPNFIFD
ncbi:hypothetical protein D0C36_08045 [Mucilaginibacter conchicola]|uniref:Lipoprotein n=1 Tax=Mucilaginibacter conchicola TaxID=2303333 RepID=A0A372NZL5_9SPHI|nr:hypothetical protein [Mucilaginibacter conchicola]RFZ95462.1 hypothetical protein D0C36_08045 [Mucilaginibacter conchicola]